MAANGQYYSLSLAQKGGQGWWVFNNSANLAKNSVNVLSKIGNVLGLASTVYSGTKFATNPNFNDGVEFGVGVLSTAFWEAGALYYGGKVFFKATVNNTKILMKNGINPGMQFIINKE